MKLQKLTIHNIASLKDAEIDFEHGPLANSEVFLIAGETGSGKSTILDCICLALYNATPRLTNKVIIDAGKADFDPEVKVFDPRQLLRRDATECFVNLTFIGSNGVSYAANWSVARARKKMKGQVQGEVWTLKNLRNGDSLTRKKDIAREIENAVGLTFEQFCRTTMLAQGEFTKFLKSTDDEKANILEKITGVDEYSKIGKKIFELYASKRRDAEEAQLLVNGVVTLTDEQVAERGCQLAKLNEECNSVDKAIKVANTKKKWIQDNATIQTKVEKGMVDYTQALELIKSEQFKQQQQQVARWKGTVDARGWLKDISQQKQKITSQEEQLTMLSNDFSAVVAGKLWLEENIAKLKGELTDINTELAAEASRVAVYEQEQTICTLLQNILADRSNILNETKAIALKSEMLNGPLAADKERTKKALAKANEDVNKNNLQVHDLDAQLTDAALPDLRQLKEAEQERINTITAAQTSLSTLNKERERAANLKAALDVTLTTINEKSSQLENIAPRLAVAKAIMDDRKLAMERQQDSVNSWAVAIRRKLQVGDACPVCGVTIENHLPLEAELAKLYEDAEKSFNEAEKSYNDLDSLKRNLEAELRSYRDRYTRDKQAFDADKSVDEALQMALQACSKCGLESVDDDTAEKLVMAMQLAQESLSSLNEKIKAAEVLFAQLKAAQNTDEQLRRLLDKAHTDVEAATKAIDNCSTQIEISRQLIQTKQADIAAAESKVMDALGNSSWAHSWQESTAEFIDELKTATATFSKRVERQSKLSLDIENNSQQLSDVTAGLDNILKIHEPWQQLTSPASRQYPGLLAQVHELRTAVALCKNNIKEASAKADEDLQRLNSFFEATPEESVDALDALNAISADAISLTEQQINASLTKVSNLQTLLEQYKQEQKAHRESCPGLSENDTPEQLDLLIAQLSTSFSEYHQQIGAINNELQQDKENKAKLHDLLNDAQAKKEVAEKWKHLNELFGDKDGKNLRKIAQSFILNNLIRSANTYMKTLSDRYTLVITPGTFLISVVDRYQGGVKRLASGISGGESFLVSLALALALSDINQGLTVDTLFIDEGFGTLSGEPLRNAIDTLYNLNKQGGRRVGIISHIEELRERIPVQIKVEQPNASSASTISIVTL